MKTTILFTHLLLAILCSIVQPAIAQNTSTAGTIKDQRNDVMGMDSTNLVPTGNINMVNTNPQTSTSTWASITGACGSDNGTQSS